MNTVKTPLEKFEERLEEFAKEERRGIRNPFVMVPVDPPFEHRAAEHLSRWANEISNSASEINVREIWLDELLPQTEVFQLVLNLGAYASGKDSIEETLRNNLGKDLVEIIINQELGGDIGNQSQILLLLKLGSLYPFTRASQLLDELDRQNVKATVGILFPGEIIAGKLSFFGEKSRHYYPAHRIDEQIKEVHLQ